MKISSLNLNKRSEALLEKMRSGSALTGIDKLSLIVSLSLPSMLAQISSVMMFFIDAAMVGHLGAGPSASIGLVESTTWLFGSMTSAASIGFSVQVAHFVGAGDFQKARQVYRHGLIFTQILALIIVAVGFIVYRPLPFWLGGGADIARDASLYFLIWVIATPFIQLSNLSSSVLKCTGNMLIPSLVSVLMCLLDVVFNYLFIFILGMGVVGAALGSAAAIVVCALIVAWEAMFRSKILALRRAGEGFVWTASYVINAAKLAAPIALQSVLMSGAQIVSTMIVAPLGNISIAANTFAITAESLCYMPGYGIGDAATTVVGQSIGARRIDMCRSFARMTVGLAMGVMAVMGVVMWIFAPEMMALLSPVADIQALGVAGLRIEAFAEPMFGAAIVSAAVCVGAGDTVHPALINLVSMWCVRLSLAAWLAADYGLPGVWFAMAVELTFRGIVFLVHLARGKWIKKSLAE